MAVSKEKEIKILELYNEGLGINKIATQLKIKKNVIKDIIKNSGVQNDIQNVGQSVLQEVIQEDTIEEVAVTKINNRELTKCEKYLNTNFDVLVEIIESYKAKDSKYKDTNNTKAEVVVELPIDDVKEFKTSIRVNKVVWEQFKEFCKNNRHYTQKDLVSMAMLEYIEKYR